VFPGGQRHAHPAHEAKDVVVARDVDDESTAHGIDLGAARRNRASSGGHAEGFTAVGGRDCVTYRNPLAVADCLLD
jgi:hypothetical protein